MAPGRRLRLAAASGAVGAACALAPGLPWLAVGHNGHCGWTCYVPLPAPSNVAHLDGRAGTQIALGLAIALFVVATLCAAVLVLAVRGRTCPPLLGRVLAVVALGALLWTVAVIVRYAEGGTLVRTDRDGVFAATVGAGAIVSLAGAACAALLGGGVALGARWAGAQDGSGASPARGAGETQPGSSRS